MRENITAAAAARAAEIRTMADRPSARSSVQLGSARTMGTLLVRSIEPVKRDGRQGVLVGGMASVTERAYEMQDCFGLYNEVVDLRAFDDTLDADPSVEFNANHGAGGGLPMAHTRNKTLELAARTDKRSPTGLEYEAFVDPTRSDVANLLSALERGDLADASFKFRIDSGVWSPDFTEFRIQRVDLDRGDVSAVNVGASPHASSGLRAAPAATVRRTLAAEVDRILS